MMYRMGFIARLLHSVIIIDGALIYLNKNCTLRVYIFYLFIHIYVTCDLLYCKQTCISSFKIIKNKTQLEIKLNISKTSNQFKF